ncbi:hypothetical protein J6590_106585, partial [Homalodisca vitripennis]
LQAVCSVHQTRVTYPHSFLFVPSQEVELDYEERSSQTVGSVHQTRVTYPHSFPLVLSQEVELDNGEISSQTVGSVHQRRVTYPHSFSLLLSQEVELVKIKDSAEYLAEAEIIKNCLIGIQSSQTVGSVHQTRVTYPPSFSLVLSQEVELDNGEIVLRIMRWPKQLITVLSRRVTYPHSFLLLLSQEVELVKIKDSAEYLEVAEIINNCLIGIKISQTVGSVHQTRVTYPHSFSLVLSQTVGSVHQTRVTYPPSFSLVLSQEVELDNGEIVLSILRWPKQSITVLSVYRKRVTYPHSFSLVLSQEVELDNGEIVLSILRVRKLSALSIRGASLTRTRKESAQYLAVTEIINNCLIGIQSSQTVGSVQQTRVTYPYSFSFVPSQEVELDNGEIVLSIMRVRKLSALSNRRASLTRTRFHSSQTVGSVHQTRVTYPPSFSLVLSQEVELVKIKDSAEYLAVAEIINNCLIGIKISQTVGSVHQTRVTYPHSFSLVLVYKLSALSIRGASLTRTRFYYSCHKNSQTVGSVHQTRVTYPHSFSLVLSQEVELDNGEIVLSILRSQIVGSVHHTRVTYPHSFSLVLSQEVELDKGEIVLCILRSQAVCSVHQTRVTYLHSFSFFPSQEVELDYGERVLSTLRLQAVCSVHQTRVTYPHSFLFVPSQEVELDYEERSSQTVGSVHQTRVTYPHSFPLVLSQEVELDNGEIVLSILRSQTVGSVHQRRVTYPHSFSLLLSQEVELVKIKDSAEYLEVAEIINNCLIGIKISQTVGSVHQTRVTYPHSFSLVLSQTVGSVHQTRVTYPPSFSLVLSQEVELDNGEIVLSILRWPKQSITVLSVYRKRVTYPHSFSLVLSQEVELDNGEIVLSILRVRKLSALSIRGASLTRTRKESAQYLAVTEIINNCLIGIQSSQTVGSVQQTRVTYPYSFSFVPSQEVELDNGEIVLSIMRSQTVGSVHQTYVTYPHSFSLLLSQEVELVKIKDSAEYLATSQTVGSVHQRRVTYPHSFSLLLSQEVELVKIKDRAEYLAVAEIINNCLIGIQSSQTVGSVHRRAAEYLAVAEIINNCLIGIQSSQTVGSVHQRRVTYPHSFSLLLSQEVELVKIKDSAEYLAVAEIINNRLIGIKSSQTVGSVHPTRVTYPHSFSLVLSQEVELDNGEIVLSILRWPK